MNETRKKLMEFLLTVQQTKNDEETGELLVIPEVFHYNVYGNYTFEEGEEAESSNEFHFQRPIFSDVYATQLLDGKEIPYVPTKRSWNGRRFVVDDMLENVLAYHILGNTQTCQLLYIEEGLKAFIDSFHTDDNFVLEVSGLKIYKHALSLDLSDLLTLNLVTKECIYYVSDCKFYMLDTSDHFLLSDNEFAEMGYWDSIEEIQNGSDTLLWGELPSEEEINKNSTNKPSFF